MNESENINEIQDIGIEELLVSKIKNVLILNMSTLKDIDKLKKNTYTYSEDPNVQVTGYGQLEPVPKLLNNHILKDAGEKLDLIIITASRQTLEKQYEFVLEEDPEKRLKTSAVCFFKNQIQKECGKDLKFFTIQIVNDYKALADVTEIIRKLNNINKDLNVYMDIHGGLRDVQLLFNAILVALNSEGIYIKQAYTCEYDGDTQVISPVTEKIQIFRMISGINEFINYGSGRELKNYVELSSGEGTNKLWREQLIRDIQNISDALSLCKIREFERNLDSLAGTIANAREQDDLFGIFIKNIENDYGMLLDREKRNLYVEVEWAARKFFYQQALAIIEANTPEYVFEKLFDLDSLVVSCRGLNMQDAEKNLKKNKLEFEAETSFYMKIIYFASVRNKKKAVDLENQTEFHYQDKKENVYVLTFKKKNIFNWDKFKRVAKNWWIIKQDYRNKIFHLNEQPNINQNTVNSQLNRFLKSLQELDESIRARR